MTDLDRILDRLALLQSRAQDVSSPEEAAVAAALIEDLLTKYNLNMAQVNSRAKNRSALSDEFIDFSFDIGAKTQWLAQWRRDLLHYLSLYNFCRSITITRTPIVNIVGERHNIRVVVELYRLIETQVRHLTNVYYRAHGYAFTQSEERRWRAAFADGCVTTIASRIKHQRDQTLDSLMLEQGTTMALVERKDDEVRIAYAKFHPDAHTTHLKDRSREVAYRWGQRAGQEVTINHPLEGRR